MKNKFIILSVLLLVMLLACSCQDVPENGGLSGTEDNSNSENTDDIKNESQNENTSEEESMPETQEKCEHSFGEWSTVKEPTCKDQGKSVRICTLCSAEEEKAIETTDVHTAVVDAAIAATCAQEGFTEGSHCSVCNKVLVARERIPKTDDHTPVTDPAISATCQSVGLTEGSHCEVCRIILVKQNEIPKEPHNYIDGYCDVCKERKVSSGLKFEDCDGYASVVGIGSCTDTVVIIPDIAPSGLPVKEIGMQAFQNCTNIVEVIIPNAVGYIGMEAFMNCISLEKITLPDAYWDMGLRTFKNCTSLKEVVIPNNVFRVGSLCFENCTSLESVTIPASVTTYSKDAFKGCVIKNLYISSLDAWCSSKFYNSYANPLYSAENLYLGQTLVTTVELNKDVSDLAFIGYDKLTRVVLGNSVKSVGNSAFYECGELMQVVFGNKIETINTAAFYNCTKLNEVHLPSSLKTISNKAFYGCSALQTITVSNGLESLGDYAFSGCRALREIDLPSTVTYMGISSFEKCASLESITIPFVGVATRTEKYSAFGSIFGDAQYEGGEMVMQYYNKYSYCIPKSLKHVTLLSATPTSAGQEFVNCKYLEIITYGKNVTRVTTASIAGCDALTNIYYEGTKEQWQNLHYSEQFNSIEGITVTCSDGVVEKS